MWKQLQRIKSSKHLSLPSNWIFILGKKSKIKIKNKAGNMRAISAKQAVKASFAILITPDYNMSDYANIQISVL